MNSATFVTFLGIFIGNVTQGLIVPAIQVVQPGQNFTYSCDEKTAEPSVWEIYDWAVVEGIRSSDSNSSITCYVSEEKRKITSITCLDLGGKWNTTHLQIHDSIPITIMIDTKCLVDDSVFLHIGLPPEPPANLTCLMQNINRAYCRWDQPPKYIGDVLFDAATSYSLTYTPTDRLCYCNEFTSCHVTNTQNWCEESLEKHQRTTWIYFPHNITLTARNSLGNATSSLLVDYFSTMPSAPVQVTTRSAHDEKNQKSKLYISIHNTVSPIYGLDYEIQYVYTQEAVRDAQWHLNSTEKFNFWTNWKELGSKAFAMRQEHEETTFWQKAETYYNTSIMDVVQVELLAKPNSTVVVRARVRMRVDLINQWSDYTVSRPIKTKPVAPRKPQVAFLWFQDHSRNKTQASEALEILCKTESDKSSENIAMEGCYINETCTRHSSRGSIRALFAGCAASVASFNDVGASATTSGRLADHKHPDFQVKSATVEVLNHRSVSITFTRKGRRHGRNMDKGLTLVVFFWPIQDTWYSLHDLLSYNDQTTEARDWSSAIDPPPVTQEMSKEGKQYLIFHKGRFTDQTTMTERQQGPKRLDSPPTRPRFINCQASRSKDQTFSYKFQSNFKPFTPYRFAVSIKVNNTQGPVKEVESAYYFTISEPHAKPVVDVEPVNDDAVKVSWNSLNPTQWQGPIAGHIIYFCKNLTCGRTKRSLLRSREEICEEICPQAFKVIKCKLTADNATSSSIISEEALERSISARNVFSQFVNELDADTTYYIRVSAFNEKGEGPCSNVKKISLPRKDLMTEVKIWGPAAAVGLIAIIVMIIMKRRLLQKKLFPKIPTPLVYLPQLQQATETAAQKNKKIHSNQFLDPECVEIFTPLTRKKHLGTTANRTKSAEVLAQSSNKDSEYVRAESMCELAEDQSDTGNDSYLMLSPTYKIHDPPIHLADGYVTAEHAQHLGGVQTQSFKDENEDSGFAMDE